MAERKKFKDTKVAGWLRKAGEVLPEIAAVGLEIATGDIDGAVGKIGDILNAKAKSNAEAARLLRERELQKLNFQKELLSIEAADRDSARKRESAFVAALGKRDWMQALVGIIGLALLSVVIYTGLFLNVEDKESFFHILGITEGIALSIFMYYFGSSRASQAKDKSIDRLLDQ